MTDVGRVTDDVAKHIGLAQYVVLEANYDVDMLRTGRYPEMLKERIVSGTGHLSNMQTAQALADNIHPGLKHVWLCHLSEENNHPELARKTVETHLRTYGILAGTDFKLDVLKRKFVTGPFFLE
jgi:phosphoribosyl 1,2-cyclic phosphodiesterase